MKGQEESPGKRYVDIEGAFGSRGPPRTRCSRSRSTSGKARMACGMMLMHPTPSVKDPASDQSSHSSKVASRGIDLGHARK